MQQLSYWDAVVLSDFIRRLGAIMLLGGIVCFSMTAWSVNTTSVMATSATTFTLPLIFQPNYGQFNSEVKFFSRQREGFLLFTSSEMILIFDAPHEETFDKITRTSSHSTEVRLQFIGANSSPNISGLDLLPGKYHYLGGSDPAQWHTDIPMYTKVRYNNVYPGIHMIYYGNNGRLEYDVIVESGFDPHDVILSFDGVDTLSIDHGGNLVLSVGEARLVYQKPVIYQDSIEPSSGDSVMRTRVLIEGGYRITSDGRVGFNVAVFDRTKSLVIDPVLVYSSYLGGRGFDQGSGIGLDATGHVFVAGTTNGGFPISSSLQPTGTGAQDVFVSKFTPAGDELIYSTVIGGRDIDVANDIAVDANGEVYVVGSTFSKDFPSTNGSFQPSISGGVDAFVFKLNSEGSELVYSTFLGTSETDIGLGVAVDSAGEVFITGRTGAKDFLTSDAVVQPQSGGGNDAFVTRLDASGTALLYSTYLGGVGDDQGEAIAVDSFGQVVVTGVTDSEDFPTTEKSVQTVLGGRDDAFIVKLNSEGTEFEYSSYLGGMGDDRGRGVALDNEGNGYIVGGTRSIDFPTTEGVFQPDFGSNNEERNGDVFVSKVSPAGEFLVFSTYIGGQRDDTGNDIALDLEGNTYITGRTTSDNFPIINAVQGEKNGGIFDGEIFAAKLHSDGALLAYSTYIGGESDDKGTAIIVDHASNAYIVGKTLSVDFPTLNAHQETFGMESDAVILKFTDVEQLGLPDLAAVITKFKHKVKASGDQLVVKLTIGNFGTHADIAPFFVSLFVSDDDVFGDDDRPARQSFRVEVFEPGTWKFKVRELEPLSEKFVIIVIDEGDAVVEGNESNNMLIRPIGRG